jgi:hypothetical protein
MRLTLTSAMEPIDFLLKECDFQFVLSEKFKQDCLEVRFHFLKLFLLTKSVT